MTKKLWQASKSQKKNSNLFQFENYISKKFNKKFNNDYQKILDWSIKNSPDFWSSFWEKKETLYDHLRRVSNISGEEAAQLAAMTDAEIDKLIRTAADPTAAVTDKDALKALRLAMSQNVWRSLPGWVRKSIIVTILSGGFAISVVKFIANAGFGLMSIGEEKIDEYEDKLNVSVGGGINKLKPENEDKTLPVIQQLQPGLFDNTGGLKSEYSLSYPTDGSNVDVIDNNTFNVVHTFTLEQINSKL